MMPTKRRISFKNRPFLALKPSFLVDKIIVFSIKNRRFLREKPRNEACFCFCRFSKRCDYVMLIWQIIAFVFLFHQKSRRWFLLTYAIVGTWFITFRHCVRYIACHSWLFVFRGNAERDKSRPYGWRVWFPGNAGVMNHITMVVHYPHSLHFWLFLFIATARTGPLWYLFLQTRQWTARNSLPRLWRISVLSRRSTGQGCLCRCPLIPCSNGGASISFLCVEHPVQIRGLSRRRLRRGSLIRDDSASSPMSLIRRRGRRGCQSNPLPLPT